MSDTKLPDDSAQKHHIAQIRPPKYDFATFEKKWRTRWEEQKLYQVDLRNARRPYYNLMMFPYPSAEGLHVGNLFAFTGADIQGRHHRQLGYTVFEPLGFDAFGIHSENFALKNLNRESVIDCAAASASGSRSSAISRPEGPRRSRIARLCPPRPNVPST